jgi:hypothetical protein
VTPDRDAPRGSSWKKWVEPESSTEGAPVAEPHQPGAGFEAEADDFAVDLLWPDADPVAPVGPGDELTEGEGTEEPDGYDEDGYDEDDLDDLLGRPAVDPADGADFDDDDEPFGGPLLPAMVTRIDTVHGSVAALSMRLEALISATGTIRSSLSDRVDEYAAVVSRASLTQAHDLDDYRRATERTVAELRRGSAETSETLHRLGGRIDELATDLATVTDLVRAAPAPSPRAPIAAPSDGLLDVADAMLAEIADVRIQADLVPGIADDLARLRDEVAALSAAVQQVRSDVLAGSAGAPLPAATVDVHALRVEIAALRDLVMAILDGLPASQEGSAGVDQAITAAIDRLRDDIVASGRQGASPAPPIDLAALADAVVERIEALVEVVPDDRPAGAFLAPALDDESKGRRRSRQA